MLRSKVDPIANRFHCAEKAYKALTDSYTTIMKIFNDIELTDEKISDLEKANKIVAVMQEK